MNNVHKWLIDNGVPKDDVRYHEDSQGEFLFVNGGRCFTLEARYFALLNNVYESNRPEDYEIVHVKEIEHLQKNVDRWLDDPEARFEVVSVFYSVLEQEVGFRIKETRKILL